MFVKENLDRKKKREREGKERALHKKWSFPLKVSSVNVTKNIVSGGFGHIYWRNLWWKTSFFVQWGGGGGGGG